MQIYISISLSCQMLTYRLTIDSVSMEIGRRSLEKAPVSPLVVGDISFHLVLDNFIWQEHSFNPGDLRRWEMQNGKDKNNREKTLRYSALRKSWRPCSTREGKSESFWQGALFWTICRTVRNQNNIWHGLELFLLLLCIWGAEIWRPTEAETAPVQGFSSI